jgi:hypothetical protein
MAYDEDLADRVRSLMVNEPAVTEQRMFGGLAFLIGGRLAIAVSGHGGLLVRVDPTQSSDLLATTTATPMEMRGRAMGGWLRVAADDVRSPDELARWVARGMRYARSLPARSR